MRALFVKAIECHKRSARDIEAEIQKFYDYMTEKYPNFHVSSVSVTEGKKNDFYEPTFYVIITYTK